ncbi:MAG TPA: multicopper oxidase domain-containing protein [Pyrinomonadaceae bacterium]|jgi:FtsP/CotA-like multicopper oxidase with cupredoxin domain
MKKANKRIIDGNQPIPLAHPPADLQIERALPATSRWQLIAKSAGIIAGLALATVIALWLWGDRPARAQNLGSPPFANPSEVHYRAAEKRLRAIMLLTSGKYSIPNIGSATLRQFRGWDPKDTAPNLGPNSVAPGPTLRARLGDKVEISFFNKIDDSEFAYTFDTNSPGGKSSFGCDQSGTTYPGRDLFPNCFHGSSTANIHFHGTHTSPDGLGDNVLVQVLPQPRQPDWSRSFDKLFNDGIIPQRWAAMPRDYKQKQLDMIKAHDAEAASAAAGNNLPAPQSLYEADMKMIHAGQWPQYLMGAFPNFFVIPDYDSGRYKAGQAPGTHWYHAHKHGSTSLHIRNGLAGAFIIESNREGGYDHVIRRFYKWGDNYGDHEKIFVFQEFDPTANLERSPKTPGGPVNPGKGSSLILVNGLMSPTITMQPGEVQLWRMINATEGNGAGVIKPTLFQTAGFTFKQTAADGVQFSPDNYANQPFLNAKAPNGQVPGGLKLAGGNRADLLVQAPTTPGVYSFSSGGTLFFVQVVAGDPVSYPNGPFPTTWARLPKFLDDLRKPGPRDVKDPDSPVKFQWEPGRAGPGLLPKTPDGFPPHFMINDKQFEDTGPRIDQCMPLNGLQDWVLENYTNVIAHPFHIHINPFQVLQIQTPTAENQYTNYTPPNNYVWQDVIAIPPAVIIKDANGAAKSITPGRVIIRQTYLDFTGTYVLHCHILAHEDRGMMQLVRVVPAALYRAGCQDHIPIHH